MCEVAELVININNVDLLPVLQIKEDDYIALLEKIKELEFKINVLENRPKTSLAQLKANKKYIKENPEVLKHGQKKYYEKKKLDSEWVAIQNQKRSERYYKKKLELVIN